MGSSIQDVLSQIGGNSGVPVLASMPGGGSSPSFADELAKILGQVKGVTGQVGSVAQDLGNLTALIPAPNVTKIDQTNAATNLEQAAHEIERQVNSGLMTPDAGLAALTALQGRAVAVAGTGVGATPTIAAIKAQLQSKRTVAAQAPIGAAGLTGDPAFQREQFGNAIRARLTGTGSGGIDNTPAGSLTTPFPSAIARVPDVTALVNTEFPSQDNSVLLDALKNRLTAATTRQLAY